MSASDGSFDGTVEGIGWEGALAAPPGVMCSWIHAEDMASNWGPYTSLCFVVIDAGPDTVAPTSASLATVRLANGNQDLDIRWLRPWDEGLFGGTTGYRVLRATSAHGPYVDVSGAIPGNGSAAYEFVDPGRGADASDYLYRIETVDAANNVTVQSVKSSTGATVVMGFAPAGPYHVRNLSDTEVFATGAGYWIRVPASVTWTLPGW